MSQPPSLPQNLSQDRLDFLCQCLICIANPGDIRGGIERVSKWFSLGTADHNARFLGNQRRTNIVRVATVAKSFSARLERLPGQWSEIGYEAVLSEHQPVQLPTGATILIFKYIRIARFTRSQ